MRGLVIDLRAALRRMVRHRGHALVWSGTLTLALGVAAAVYGLVDAVLLRPLPYPGPGRLVRIHTAFPGSGLSDLSLSAGEFTDLQERSDAFDAVGGYIPDSYTMTGRGDATRLEGAWTTPGFFRTLGVQPAVGRVFSEAEREPDAPRLAVLSDGLWRARFGADPAIVGRTITLDGVERTVVGVMPAGFGYPHGAQIWTSLRLTPGMLAPGSRGDRYMRVVGRLRADVRPGGLEARLRSLVPTFRREHPSYYADPGFRLTSTGLRDAVLGDVRPPFLALLAGVALVLLVAAGNLGTLSLVRTVERSREMALRSSLGASRARLARQVTLEHLLLGLAGGAGGAALGWWGVRLLVRVAPAGVPRLDTARPDVHVLAFGLIVAVGVGLVAGALPALLGTGRRPGSLLRGAGHVLGTPGEAVGRRVRDLLVAGQVAVTLVLLVSAGLVIRSLDRLGRVDPGLDSTHTLTARVGLPESSYGEPGRVRGFYGRLLAGVRSIPGVRSAGAAAILPMNGGSWEVSFEMEGRPHAEGAPEPALQYRPVTPGFFQTLHVPLVRGRLLTDADGPDAALVAVVNEAFAARYLPGGALGARIRLPRLGVPLDEHVRTVVGVVGDIRTSLADAASPTLYVPHAQQPERTMTLVVRGDGDARALAGPIRNRLEDLDRTLPLDRVRTMASVVGDGMAPHRFVSFLLGIFSTTGLVLACLGVWAVVSYGVARRSREVGIRMALGARPAAMTAAVCARGVGAVALGILVGLVASFPAVRTVRSLTFGVGAHDPSTLVVAALVVLAAGAAAAWLPARRAASIDPAIVLREE